MLNDKNKLEFSKKIAIAVLLFSAVYIMLITVLATFCNVTWNVISLMSTFLPIPVTIILAYTGKAGVENAFKITKGSVDNDLIKTILENIQEQMDKENNNDIENIENLDNNEFEDMDNYQG